MATHPAVMARPTPLPEAIRAVETLTAVPSARVLLPGERFLRIFLEIVRESNAAANLVFDAAIAAVCLEHGVREILTEDRDFARFSGIKAVRLRDSATRR